MGLVHTIFGTSNLEYGLKVQSCNLVTNFLTQTAKILILSFVEPRGSVKLKISDFFIIIKSGNLATKSSLEKYLDEQFCYSSTNEPFDNDLYHEETYTLKTLFQ